MKINEEFKNVLFYGRILQVKCHASHIAANADGEIFAFLGEPYCLDARKIWHGAALTRLDAVVRFNDDESWKDTLTCCKDEGQDWMLDLKTKIAVEYALANADVISRETALCNIVNSLPSILGKPYTPVALNQQWNAFYKHSGVMGVADNNFLSALGVKMCQVAMRYVEAEKCERLEDGSRLVQDYYGAELVLPEWAKFIAMDSNGRVWAYDEKPEAIAHGNGTGAWAMFAVGELGSVGWRSATTAEKVWRDSLREVKFA